MTEHGHDPSPHEDPPKPKEVPLAFRVVRGGLWVAAGSYVNIVFGFIANLLLTRILTPEDFGVVALGAFFAGLFNLRLKLAVGYAFAHRRELTGNLIGTYFGIEVATGVLGLLIAVAAVPILLHLGYATEVIWVVLALAVAGVLEAILSPATGLLDKSLQFKYSSQVISSAFLLSYLPGFWLALNGGGFWSIVVQQVAYSGLMIVGMWWMARRHVPAAWEVRWHFDFVTARQMIRFGSQAGAALLLGMLLTQYDNFLIGTFVSVTVLGFYDRAYRIAQWPTQLVTSALSRTALFTYSHLQDDPVRLRKVVAMTLWLITTLALPLAAAIFAAAPDMVLWFYGERWLPCVFFLRFLVVYSVIRPLLDDAGSLFVAIGKPYLAALVTGVAAGVLVGLGTVLTLLFEATGTVVAVAAAFVVALLLTYYYVVRIVQIRIFHTILVPFVSTAGTLALHFLLVRLIPLAEWPVWLSLFTKVGYVVLIYFALLLLMQPKITIGRVRYIWRLFRRRESAADIALW